ncbi:conserved hypothetical protein [Arthrobacter sp. FB24]|uniref:DUF2264 domain-containing protein n=1 Tax=Arthrobacter sp. (strain FB24) TaxID=290399 RepID=UPI0000527112|nr:DUF2264 domain-containing protein [Arthrobacter sp. FB24]ABK03097.1 conserved hypothetical protein [Arthrobacter sp. FB24]
MTRHEHLMPTATSTEGSLTGWDRASWEDLADKLIAGALTHSSPRGARVAFPSATGQNDTAQLEGFARSFLLASLRIAGSPGARPDLIGWYADALAAGTQAGGVEAWPVLRDHGQPTVEATAIALALHLSRAWLWESLDDGVKNRVVLWLSGSRGRYGADNNHVLFGATIQAFLASVGAPFDVLEIEGALDRIEDWYAGDGWYSDGEGRRFDHYNAWTFHLYPFFIVDMLSGTAGQATGSSERLRLYRSRLREFLRGYEHLFSAAGSPLIQGRSLIYRWGVVAPFWMGEIQGVSPLPAGRTRRLASGVAKHFVDHGVGADGVLSLGWWKENTGILQSYNAPGSPLWSSKGFLGLLLPVEHPAWSHDETGLEIERRDVREVLSGPQWLVHATQRDDIVRVANFGSGGHPRYDSHLYRRLAFSTATAPVQYGDLRDNDIYIPLQDATSTHRGPLGGVARPHGGSLRFLLDAAGRGVSVDYATTILDGSVELRAARVRGAVALPLTVSGYALSSDQPMDTGVRGGCARATTHDGLSSSIALVSIQADASSAPAAQIRYAPESILGEKVAVPAVRISPARSTEIRIAWLVSLSRREVDLSAIAAGLELNWSNQCLHASIGNTARSLPWMRHDKWPADSINQGIFGG